MANQVKIVNIVTLACKAHLLFNSASTVHMRTNYLPISQVSGYILLHIFGPCSPHVVLLPWCSNIS